MTPDDGRAVWATVFADLGVHPRSDLAPASRPAVPTDWRHQEAAKFGAAVARMASTLTFEDGRPLCAEEFTRPGDYEAAYDSLHEIWMTVRRDE